MSQKVTIRVYKGNVSTSPSFVDYQISSPVVLKAGDQVTILKGNGDPNNPILVQGGGSTTITSLPPVVGFQDTGDVLITTPANRGGTPTNVAVITGYFVDVFCTIISPTDHITRLGDPEFVVNQAMLLEKDFQGHGFIGTSSDSFKGFGGGAILMGEGFTGLYCPPMFTLTGTMIMLGFSSIPTGNSLPATGTYLSMFNKTNENKIYQWITNNTFPNGTWTFLYSYGSGSFPASPTTGQLFFRTDLNALYVYNNAFYPGSWLQLGTCDTIGGYATGTYAAMLAMSNPINYQWFRTSDTHTLYQYFTGSWHLQYPNVMSNNFDTLFLLNSNAGAVAPPANLYLNMINLNAIYPQANSYIDVYAKFNLHGDFQINGYIDTSLNPLPNSLLSLGDPSGPWAGVVATTVYTTKLENWQQHSTPASIIAATYLPLTTNLTNDPAAFWDNFDTAGLNTIIYGSATWQLGIGYSGIGADYCLSYGNSPITDWQAPQAWLPSPWTNMTWLQVLAWWKTNYGFATSRIGFCFASSVPTSGAWAGKYGQSVLGVLTGGVGPGYTTDYTKMDTLCGYMNSIGVKMIALNQNNPVYDVDNNGNEFVSPDAASSNFIPNWQAFANHYKTGTTLGDAFAAFDIFGEPNDTTFYEFPGGNSETIGLNELQRWADCIAAIHLIDPDRVCIFPFPFYYHWSPTGLLGLTSWHDDLLQTMINGHTILNEPNVSFDILHPYWFPSNQGQPNNATGDPVSEANYYIDNFLTPTLTFIPASKCWLGETFLYDPPADANQQLWITTIIEKMMAAGVGFSLWNELTHTSTALLNAVSASGYSPAASGSSPYIKYAEDDSIIAGFLQTVKTHDSNIKVYFLSASESVNFWGFIQSNNNGAPSGTLFPTSPSYGDYFYLSQAGTSNGISYPIGLYKWLLNLQSSTFISQLGSAVSNIFRNYNNGGYTFDGYIDKMRWYNSDAAGYLTWTNEIVTACHTQNPQKMAGLCFEINPPSTSETAILPNLNVDSVNLYWNTQSQQESTCYQHALQCVVPWYFASQAATSNPYGMTIQNGFSYFTNKFASGTPARFAGFAFWVYPNISQSEWLSIDQNLPLFSSSGGVGAVADPIVLGSPLSVNGSAGTVGQLLQSKGSGLPPVWATVNINPGNNFITSVIGPLSVTPSGVLSMLDNNNYLALPSGIHFSSYFDFFINNQHALELTGPGLIIEGSLNVASAVVNSLLSVQGTLIQMAANTVSLVASARNGVPMLSIMDGSQNALGVLEAASIYVQQILPSGGISRVNFCGVNTWIDDQGDMGVANIYTQQILPGVGASVNLGSANAWIDNQGNFSTYGNISATGGLIGVANSGVATLVATTSTNNDTRLMLVRSQGGGAQYDATWLIYLPASSRNLSWYCTSASGLLMTLDPSGNLWVKNNITCPLVFFDTFSSVTPTTIGGTVYYIMYPFTPTTILGASTDFPNGANTTPFYAANIQNVYAQTILPIAGAPGGVLHLGGTNIGVNQGGDIALQGALYFKDSKAILFNDVEILYFNTDTITGGFLPYQNDKYSLGGDTNRWRHIYGTYIHAYDSFGSNNKTIQNYDSLDDLGIIRNMKSINVNGKDFVDFSNLEFLQHEEFPDSVDFNKMFGFLLGVGKFSALKHEVHEKEIEKLKQEIAELKTRLETLAA